LLRILSDPWHVLLNVVVSPSSRLNRLIGEWTRAAPIMSMSALHKSLIIICIAARRAAVVNCASAV
jgi:hypothetical protein